MWFELSKRAPLLRFPYWDWVFVRWVWAAVLCRTGRPKLMSSKASHYEIVFSWFAVPEISLCMPIPWDTQQKMTFFSLKNKQPHPFMSWKDTQLPWSNWWSTAFSAVKSAHVYCLSGDLASECSTIEHLWNWYGKEKFLFSICQILLLDLRIISSGFIFLVPWKVKMNGFVFSLH